MIRISQLTTLLSMDAPRAYQVVAVGRQLAAIIIGIMVVKAGWDKELVGELEHWFFLGMLLTLGFVVGIVQAYTAIAPSFSAETADELSLVTYLLTCAGLLMIATVLIVLPSAIPAFLGISGISLLLHGMLFLALHLSAVLAVNILLVRSRTLALLRYAWCYLIGMPLALGCGLLISNDLAGALKGLIGFALLEHIYLIFLLPRWHRLQAFRDHLTKLLRRALPLIAYSIIGAIGLWFDGWLVNRHYDNAGVFAIFRYGAREMPGALAMAGAFSTAMIAVLSENVVRLDRLRQGSVRLMHLFMPISMIFLIISPWLFKTVYSQEFVESAKIFNIYLLLMLSRWIFGHSIMIAKGEDFVLLTFSVLEVIINIALSLYLVDCWGLSGIAIATVIAFTFEKIAIGSFLWIKFGIDPSKYISLFWFFPYSIALCTIYYIVTF